MDDLKYIEFSDYDFIVVGAGLYGATVANVLTEKYNKQVLVIERRKHVAGNAYSYRDKETGIEIHKYGSHIFHTDDEEVYDYLSQFTTFLDYKHTVKTRHNGELYPMPINLDTINKFYGTKMKAKEAEKFIAEEATKAGISDPQNFEEKGISLVGEKLYNAFIKNYSEKQWSTSATNLSADILSRIPVRFSRNDLYFMDALYQGVPDDGYGMLVDRMFDNVQVVHGVDYMSIMDEIPEDIPVIYCGQVDELLNYELGVLPYRSLRFEGEWVDENTPEGADSKLGYTVINEADADVPYTRTHFYKYYQISEPEVINQPKSYIVREYPADFKRGGEAYYPVNNDESEELYQRYVALLHERYPQIYLGGRLGAYRYWDMDKAVRNALDFVKYDLKIS